MLELQWRAYAEEGGTMCGWDDECQRGPHPLPPGLVVQDVWKRKHFTWKGPRKKTMLRRSKLFVKTMWWKKQLARMWGLWLQRVTIGGFEGVWEIWEMGSDWRRGVGGWGGGLWSPREWELGGWSGGLLVTVTAAFMGIGEQKLQIIPFSTCAAIHYPTLLFREPM